ncbi:hypothetical protein CWI39_0015p0040 [Hamiltosporidium magnivora]|uniref:Uncharacterized protein n=1 Tax=Hamiltosporidium magnivora TaxID=148818 RepID=A0A4Q9LQQ7_9MICR|nr:hypothetical protein CWI39_0015p0040 [Hamiltosporidium magnivora]
MQNFDIEKNLFHFLDLLSERSEFIVCENSDSENKYTVYRADDIESLSKIEKLIKNLKDTYQQYTSEKLILFNKNIPGKNKDFYLKIFNKIHLKIKLKFLSALILSVSFYKSGAFTNTNHISNLESSSDSLKVLFEKYDLISIKKLCLCYFTISELNVETFGNLFNLMDFTVYRNIFQNTYFSELFCTSHEYNIKKLLLVEINIVEKDLRFTANLKKLKSVELRACKIDQTPYSFLKFMFEN